MFQPGAVRVTAVAPTIGATVQPGPVLTTTLTTRQVQIQLDSALESDVKVGDTVSVTLPDNQNHTRCSSPTSGQSRHCPPAAANGGGSNTPTINVYVTPTDPAATGDLDQAPVNVSITTESVSNVLVVPVDALLALASGGYAVEEIGAGELRNIVAGQPPEELFDDANRQRQVRMGARVVVPNV